MNRLPRGLIRRVLFSTEVSPVGTTALVPIDFKASSTIEGEESQIVKIDLQPNQKVLAETGAMLYMTQGVEIETGTSGGFGQGLKRMMTGENFFVSHFTYSGPESGSVAFGTNFPSKIIHVSLSDFGGSLICQKGAFLCGSSTIEIEMEFTKKFSAGFFGGEGFVLQRLTGEGDAFIRAGGALIERELKPDEELRISSGCLVAFEPTVSYDISTMKGFKNVVFGGEGLFVTTLTGPGKVYLQGLPFDRVIDQMARRMPGGGGGMFMPLGMGGMGGGGAGGDGSSTGGEGDAAEDQATTDSAPVSDNDSNTMDNEPVFAQETPSGQGEGEEVWGQDTGVESSGMEQDEETSVTGFLKDLFFGNDDN